MHYTGEILQEALTKTGITQYELSKKTGIPQGTISRMISNNSKANLRNNETLTEFFSGLNVINQDIINIFEHSNSDIRSARKQRKWTQKDLADKLGVTVLTVQNYESGKKIPESKHKIIENVLFGGSPPNNKLPFFNIDASTIQALDFENISHMMEYHIDYPPFNNGVGSFKMIGDSMCGVYEKGETLAVKPAPKEVHSFGQAHLIITNSGYWMIRFLRKHPTDTKKFLLRSSNKDYDDTEILKSDVHELYLVIGSIKQNSF